MQRAFGFTLLVFTLACSSSGTSRPAGVAAPTIVVEQANTIFFGSGLSAPVTMEVHVRNNANVPIRVREVEIRSPGMSQYTLQRTSRLFSETVPPGETRTVSLIATAVREQTRFRAEEPLSISAVIRLEANGTQFREIILSQIAGSGTN